MVLPTQTHAHFEHKGACKQCRFDDVTYTNNIKIDWLLKCDWWFLEIYFLSKKIGDTRLIFQWSFPVTVGFTILAIRTVLLSAIVLFIRVISCDIVYI